MLAPLSQHDAYVSRGSNLRINGRCVKVRGVTRSLQERFYPHYTAKKTGKGNSSLKIGSLVHREVEQWAGGTEVEKPHRYTLQIQETLKRLRLEPAVAEAPIISVTGAYLTYPDLICTHERKLDNTKEIVVVSLKTGYSNGMTRAQGYCKAPIHSLLNCAANHHMLQLACEVYVLKHEYGIPVSRGIVLYAGYGKNRGVKVLALPHWGYSEKFMGLAHRAMAVRAPVSSAVIKEVLAGRHVPAPPKQPAKRKRPAAKRPAKRPAKRSAAKRPAAKRPAKRQKT